MAGNCLSSSHMNTVDNEKLVQPNDKLHNILLEAGAVKQILTMKEVIFYLGRYIMKKQLYDKKQQHIVHCAHDALGSVLGVESFSVKEPQVLFNMITQNLSPVNTPESQSGLPGPRSQVEPDRGREETDSNSSSPNSERRRRRRAGSITEGTSTPDSNLDSDSDNFSVEFEVECIDSDAYSNNESVEMDETEGLDFPDGKRALSPISTLKDSQESPSVAGPDSQDSACSSQPTTSSSGSSGVGSGPGSASSSNEEGSPDRERFNSLDAHLPAAYLEPCIMCQSRPKNGCIVHGRTGHLMACYTCAKKLKKRNKLCPVCREPIQSVVLIYIS